MGIANQLIKGLGRRDFTHFCDRSSVLQYRQRVVDLALKQQERSHAETSEPDIERSVHFLSDDAGGLAEVDGCCKLAQLLMRCGQMGKGHHRASHDLSEPLMATIFR